MHVRVVILMVCEFEYFYDGFLCENFGLRMGCLFVLWSVRVCSLAVKGGVLPDE